MAEINVVASQPNQVVIQENTGKLIAQQGQRVGLNFQESKVDLSVSESQVASTLIQEPPRILAILGANGQGGGFEVDSSGKVDKSIVYYDSASESFKADANWTTMTLVDGGNF